MESSAHVYSEKTKDIEIQVVPTLDSEKTNYKDYYFYSYHITITNESSAAVTLRNRHWIITDGFGSVQEVRGEGVVGEQPLLTPGESFEYTSFCPLPTSTGNMRGSFGFEGSDGILFEAKVPLFFLREDKTFH